MPKIPFTSTKPKICDKSMDWISAILKTFNVVYPNGWLLEYSRFDIILISAAKCWDFKIAGFQSNGTSRAWLVLMKPNMKKIVEACKLTSINSKLMSILGSWFYYDLIDISF